jgi:hypothetical protein
MMRLTSKFAWTLGLAASLVAASVVAQQNTGAPVVSEVPAAPPPKLAEITSQDLLDGLKNPSRWLSYSGDYSGRRHSPLKQITPENVGKLVPQWTWQAEGMPINRGFESTPLMMDGALVRHRQPELRVGDRRAQRAVRSGATDGRCLRASPTAARTRRIAALPPTAPVVHGHARRAPARARS